MTKGLSLAAARVALALAQELHDEHLIQLSNKLLTEQGETGAADAERLLLRLHQHRWRNTAATLFCDPACAQTQTNTNEMAMTY